MRRDIMEASIGGLVLLVAAGFLTYAYSARAVQEAAGYQLSASFGKVGTIREGDEVRVSGIRIGTVLSQSVNPETFRARLVLRIEEDVEFPTDTRALITGEGLVGSKYVQLVPGVEETMLKHGDEIENTKDIIDLESLVGEIIRIATGSAGQE